MRRGWGKPREKAGRPIGRLLQSCRQEITEAQVSVVLGEVVRFWL